LKFFFFSLISAVSQIQPAPPGKEEVPNPQLVHTELRRARDGAENMRPLGGHATSVASATENAPADLAAAGDFETTYLEPLKIMNVINAVLEKISDVWTILVR
jgi:hypothetical protein